jgi:hypothetical protein
LAFQGVGRRPILVSAPKAQVVVGDSSACFSWHPFGHASFVTLSIGCARPSICTRTVRFGIMGVPQAGQVPGVRSVCRPKVGLMLERYNRWFG